MKKYVVPCLAVIAVIAIVLCFVFNGQKGSIQSQLDALKAESEGKIADLEKAVEDAKTEAETKVAEAAKAAEDAKAEAEATIADLQKQLEEAQAKLTEAVAPAAESAGAMTHAEYIAAENDTEVVIESYVQDHQAWWDNKVTVYLQSEDGAYFAYELACSEEDAAKLVPGAKIRVRGYKGEWAGEVEIMNGTFEFIDGDPYIAEAADVTALLGKDELANHMNEFVAVKGATVAAYDEAGAAFAYKNPEEKNDDLYFKVTVDGQTYDFCVEKYLRDESTDVYKAVEGLKVGDVIDLEGFLYWYNGANLQATGLTVK